MQTPKLKLILPSIILLFFLSQNALADVIQLQNVCNGYNTGNCVINTIPSGNSDISMSGDTITTNNKIVVGSSGNALSSIEVPSNITITSTFIGSQSGGFATDGVLNFTALILSGTGFTNNGTIRSTAVANAVFLNQSVSMANLINNGTIETTNSGASALYAVSGNSDTVVNVTNLINNGTITAQQYAFYLTNGTSVNNITNNADATITAQNSAIYISKSAIGGGGTRESNVGTITNYGTLTTQTTGNTIHIQESNITSIINHGTINAPTNGNAIYIHSGNTGSTVKSVNSIQNSGTINGKINLYANLTLNTLENSGTIANGVTAIAYNNTTINNLINTGYIGTHSYSGRHVNFSAIGSLTIQTYALKLNEDAATFNAFGDSGTYYTSDSVDNTSHLVFSAGGTNDQKLYLKNNGQILLSFDFTKFQLNTDYLLSKLVVIDNPGTTGFVYEGGTTKVGDNIYNHLVSTDPLYAITRNGSYFQVNLQSANSSSNNIHKSNISLLNTMLMQSNQAIYNNSLRKYGFPYNRISSNDKTPESRGLKSYASIAPQASFVRVNYNPSQREFYSYSQAKDVDSSFYIAQDLQTQNYRRRGFVGTRQKNAPEEVESTPSQVTPNKTPEVIEPKATQPQIVEPRIVEPVESTRDSIAIAQIAPETSTKSDNGHFFFMPFISNQQINDSDGLKSSGNTYGFITGLSGDFGSTIVGAHFGFGYGGYNNKVNLDYTQIATMLGLHLRADLVYGLFIKARADGYYFQNTINPVSTEQSKNALNSIGFDVVASFGKQWNIKSGAMKGIASIEAGLSYEGLSNSGYSFGTENYNSSLLNLLYGEIFGRYDKFFGDSNAWVLNMGLGVKYLLTGRPEIDMMLGTRNYNVVIGTDKFYGIAQLGVDYRINENLALNLNYLGMFGDRSMTNSGFFNVRLWF
ncbi:hypothetical protein CCY99_06085 [Helicobacter sp. 16-1353]|uniref:hypothetical protein n=1 Tax=Helicobacter sp. 16-1353 TaxID=2004996 RepID=UPI000DCD9B77|nr:hypothetical protein [Helicobacter sp. 16-1353]RAX53159.1 hypothetical protein CCY99_06085 [Helicobacter sp. 16-1353]